MFLKSLSAFSGPYDDIIIPRGAQKTDWEVELGVVIGTKARYVPEAAAMDHVAGYCVVNDVSERSYQSERGGTWDKGKGCDSFGPVFLRPGQHLKLGVQGLGEQRHKTIEA